MNSINAHGQIPLMNVRVSSNQIGNEKSLSENKPMGSKRPAFDRAEFGGKNNITLLVNQKVGEKADKNVKELLANFENKLALILESDQPADKVPAPPEVFSLSKIKIAFFDELPDDVAKFVEEIKDKNFMAPFTQGVSEEERRALIDLGTNQLEFIANKYLDSNKAQAAISSIGELAEYAKFGPLRDKSLSENQLSKKTDFTKIDIDDFAKTLFPKEWYSIQCIRAGVGNYKNDEERINAASEYAKPIFEAFCSEKGRKRYFEIKEDYQSIWSKGIKRNTFNDSFDKEKARDIEGFSSQASKFYESTNYELVKKSIDSFREFFGG